MQINKIYLWFLFLFMITIAACYYDKYNQIYPPDAVLDCDTAAISYSQNVNAILSENCISCHNNGNASAGVALDSYEQVKIFVQSGAMMDAINQVNGIAPMPPGSKLTECDIIKMQHWIDGGALNN